MDIKESLQNIKDLNVSFIVATSLNGVIGNNNKLPFSCKEDMLRFKNVTMDNIVIMGRKTYESIGMILPGRINIVISTSYEEEHKEIDVEQNSSYSTRLLKFNSLIKALEFSKNLSRESEPNKKIFIIGGGTLYDQILHLCNKIYLTVFLEEVEGDTFFCKETIEKYKDDILKNKSMNNLVHYQFTNSFNFTETYQLLKQFKSIERLNTINKTDLGDNPKCIFVELIRIK